MRVAEGLFTLITDLKHTALVSDFGVMSRSAARWQKEYSVLAVQSERRISQLQQELNEGILELENAYYSSYLR